MRASLTPLLRSRLTEAAGLTFALERVFVINLDRRLDRWAAIQAVCADAGITAERMERVPAVDGALIDVDAAHRCGFVSSLGLRRLREPPAHHIWGMDLNRAALGCALSHVHLWARIAALHAPTAAPKRSYLILEDDATLAGGGDSLSGVRTAAHTSHPTAPFLAQLETRMRCVPSDWDLVYVGGLDTAAQCPMMTVADGVAHVPQYHRTTSAYLVTPNGARRLLALCLPLTFQVDTVMTMKVGYPQAGMSSGSAAAPRTAKVPYVLDPVCYTLQPPLMTQAAQLGSDIQTAAP